MKFCPKCDLRLKKSSSNSVLSCPKCNYTEGQESEIQDQVSEEETKSDFLVLDENEDIKVWNVEGITQPTKEELAAVDLSRHQAVRERLDQRR